MPQNRVFYSCQRLDIGSFGSATYTFAHGVQSVGMNTNFELQEVFELGQLDLYENVEGIPSVELTAEKVLDGYPLLYHLATRTASDPSLVGRSNERCNAMLGIWADTSNYSTGQLALSRCLMSGMYPSSISYSFPVDGNFTESVTFVGNNVVWRNSSGAPVADFPDADPSFVGDDQPLAINGSGGVQRRENFLFSVNGILSTSADSNGATRGYATTVLPQDIPGINSSGVNPLDSLGYPVAKVQNVNVSVDLGRDELGQLGVRGPFHRFGTFPTEVTSSFEVLTQSGSMVSATEQGVFTGAGGGVCVERYNLKPRTIRIVTCDGTYIYLGKNNKLTSINYNGGDTGGGNVTVTYNYSNFNLFTVAHANDPNAALRPNSGAEGVSTTYLAPA